MLVCWAGDHCSNLMVLYYFILWRIQNNQEEIFFLFLNLDMILKKFSFWKSSSTSGEVSKFEL